MANVNSPDQIPNVPNKVLINDFSSTGILNTSTAHSFVVGMPIRYRGIVYWVANVIDTNHFQVTKTYNGSYFSGSEVVPTAGEYAYFAYPLTQIDETYLLPINNTYTQGTGNLAYGRINTDSSTGNRKSTLYFNNGNGYKQVKLGLDLGNTYYNTNRTFTQQYTGWCHGMGHYKIITASNQIKIKFDYLQVKELTTEAKSIVPGLRTYPASDYNALISNTGVGLNALDTGVLKANTGYYVYFVYNTTTDTYGGMLSLNGDRPDPFPLDGTSNSYYTSFQRLGWVQTDGAGNFTPSLQVNDKFCFINDPGVASTLTFKGAGTSASIPLITAGYTGSSKYPYSYYLNNVDMMVSFNGTGVNTNNIRTLSIDNIPTYQFTSDVAQSIPIHYNLNEYPLKGTNIDFSLAHPQDLGAGTIGTALVTGTDYTSLNLSFTGFKFDTSVLHI